MMLQLIGSFWGRLCAGLAQLVEQLFRKQQVPGSSPGVGSGPRMAGAQQAEVAEPADALRSGRSEGNLVGVQISPSAPRTPRVMGNRSKVMGRTIGRSITHNPRPI